MNGKQVSLESEVQSQLAKNRHYTNKLAPAGRSSRELAINSPSKLSISEGVLWVLERGRAS